MRAEPAGADDAFRSLQRGPHPPQTHPTTIADGLLTSLSERTFRILSERLEGILTVSDTNIIRAMRLLWERMKIVVEPSGAVPLAAVRQHPDTFVGRRVGLIISVGNVDLDHLPWLTSVRSGDDRKGSNLFRCVLALARLDSARRPTLKTFSKTFESSRPTRGIDSGTHLIRNCVSHRTSCAGTDCATAHRGPTERVDPRGFSVGHECCFAIHGDMGPTDTSSGRGGTMRQRKPELWAAVVFSVLVPSMAVDAAESVETCSSCADCQAKLSSGLYSVVELDVDIIDYPGSCIDLHLGESNVTFDCAGAPHRRRRSQGRAGTGRPGARCHHDAGQWQYLLGSAPSSWF